MWTRFVKLDDDPVYPMLVSRKQPAIGQRITVRYTGGNWFRTHQVGYIGILTATEFDDSGRLVFYVRVEADMQDREPVLSVLGPPPKTGRGKYIRKKKVQQDESA